MRNTIKMKMVPLHKICITWLLLSFTYTVQGLKCRTTQEVQQNGDFEYVVRMCLRRLRNESDFSENLYRLQNEFNYSSNKRYRDDSFSNSNNNNNNNNHNNDDNNESNENRNYYGRNQNKGFPDGFDRFWSSNDNDRHSDDDRNRPERDYMDEEPDFYNPSRGRKKYKSRPPMPHSFQQQMQHDRDIMYNHGNRESTNYFYSNRKKNNNNKFMYNKKGNSESALAEIDPCVIHCIFQEMQMIDDKGKPNRALISQKMTQKIRNSELKNFIQDSVEECFDAVEDDESNFGSYSMNGGNRHRKPEMICEWAKSFAMCLELRGKQNCEDWDEPTYNSSNNSNNSNNSKDDQKHKSNQNDRG